MVFTTLYVFLFIVYLFKIFVYLFIVAHYVLCWFPHYILQNKQLHGMKSKYICDTRSDKKVLRGLFGLSDSEVTLDNVVMKCSLTRLLNTIDSQMSKEDIDEIKRNASVELNVQNNDSLCGDESLMDWYMLTDVEGVAFLEYLSTNKKVVAIAEELHNGKKVEG